MVAINGVLIGLVVVDISSSTKESPEWQLFAAISIVAIGLWGLFSAVKHYERNRFHTAILKRIRKQLDTIATDSNSARLTLRCLRKKGEKDHYGKFS